MPYRTPKKVLPVKLYFDPFTGRRNSYKLPTANQYRRCETQPDEEYLPPLIDALPARKIFYTNKEKFSRQKRASIVYNINRPFKRDYKR